MRALRFTRFRTPAAALATVRVPLPAVASGELLVQMHAAGIGPGDAGRRDPALDPPAEGESTLAM